MKIATRILVNTLSLYAKMLITTIISLYLVRIVLEYMGENDFGIYSLIGGVIALLSFINAALLVSTQRYLSVELGKKGTRRTREILSASLQIHLGMAMAIIIALEICYLFLFDDVLNIKPERIATAKIVYQLMVISTIFTIIGVPFNAILNAKEDLWMFSIVESICSIMKLGIIIIFHYLHHDALILYTGWITIITIINFIIKYFWCFFKYKECKSLKILKKVDHLLIKELLGFSGWTSLGTLALIGRIQGIAIVLNIFWGTALNAVYGIANQVNGQLIYFSTMMTSSMTPQIMKSYGEGNLRRMQYLSVFTCKLAFYLSAVFAIPLLIEIDFILTVWLKNVPQYTSTFCSLIIFMFLIMELTPGLDRAIQATGKIKTFQIITSIAMLIPIPVGFFIGKMQASFLIILITMILSQGIQMIIAIIIGHKTAKIKIKPFLIYIFKSIIVFSIIYIGGKYLKVILTNNFSSWIIFFIICISTVLAFSVLYYCAIFTSEDKDKIKSVIKRRS